MLRKTTLSLMLLAATASPAFAQQFVLETGSIEVGELIDRAASHLGWNILVNPQELGNCGDQFKLQNRIATDRDGCEDLLTTLLATRGVVIRTLDADKSLYEAISLHGPRARECFSTSPPKTPDEILARPSLRVPVTTVVQLEHIPAVIANNALRPFFASMGGNQNSGITMGSVGNDASILFSGMQDQVASAIRLIQRCDVPQKEKPAPGIDQRLENLENRLARLEKAIAALSKEK